MLESVLPIVGAVFLVVALAFIALSTAIVFGSFLYGCVMSCIMAIQHLRHGPATTRT